MSVHHRALYEHMWVSVPCSSIPLQCSESVLTPFPTTRALPTFYYTGARTENLLLLISVPNRLSCHFLGVIQVHLTSGIWCVFNTDKLVYQLLCTNNMSVAARLPGAKNQTETGWNVGEIILSHHWNSNSCILFIEVNGSQQLSLASSFVIVVRMIIVCI